MLKPEIYNDLIEAIEAAGYIRDPLSGPVEVFMKKDCAQIGLKTCGRSDALPGALMLESGGRVWWLHGRVTMKNNPRARRLNFEHILAQIKNREVIVKQGRAAFGMDRE